MSTGDHTAPIEYREIPHRPGFRFGSNSSIQTCWTLGVTPKIGIVWRAILPSPRPNGHSWIYLGSRAATKPVRLDEIICEAFRGSRPKGTECIHCDFDRTNCHADNLFWGLDEYDTKNPNVEYRTIAEADGHEFGNDGSVWSYWAMGHSGKTDVCRRMQPTTLDRGHLQVEIQWDGEKRKFGVHVLICIAFNGYCPEGLECCHNDGVPHNNHPGNLRWDTRKKNVQDQILHGVIAAGERQGSAKLTEDRVVEARRRYMDGESTVVLAEDYGVAPKTIGLAIAGDTWGHVPEPVALRDDHGRKLSDPIILAVRAFYSEGISAPKLAALLGVSIPLITRAIRGDLGADLPGATHTRDPHARKLTCEQEEEVCRLSREGWTLKRLAEKYDVSERTIVNILNRN